MNKEYDVLKPEVMNWLNSLRIPGTNCQFKFDRNSESSIFTTCFALFIYDLFCVTDEFKFEEKINWIEYIQGFQDEDTGYFEPLEYHHKDKERNKLQLTSFCLSGLRILGALPKYRLKFVYDTWSTKEEIKRYLRDVGVHTGRSGAGNKAMFMAIFLTYEYENTNSEQILDKLNTWFDFHDAHQNSDTGFWGDDHYDQYFNASQNGFHQVIIYDYWDRPIKYIEKMLQVLLAQMNKDGSFSPIPGGESCFDSDSIILLAIIQNRLSIKIKMKTLRRALENMFHNQNADGGFAESKNFPKTLNDILRLLPIIVTKDCGQSYYKMRKSVGQVLKRNVENYTGWVKEARALDESNLWDTWFRCLAISQIENMITPNKYSGYRYHKNIGIGFVNEEQHS
jgi:prenyltransferase beta subunit